MSLETLGVWAGNLVVGGGLFAAAAFMGKAILDYLRGSSSDVMKSYSDLYNLKKLEYEEAKKEIDQLKAQMKSLEQRYERCSGDCAELRKKVEELEK